MKKNHLTKLFGLTFTAVLLTASLAACGSAGTTAPAPSADSPDTVSDAAGTLLLSVNPEIEMEYDKDGNVVCLNALNEDGRKILDASGDYAGQPCRTVVHELVSSIHQAGYFDTTIDGHARNIILKVERGSRYPSDDFLEELTREIRSVVEQQHIGSQTIALDDDNYDDTYGSKGYINAETAESILATQLDRTDLQFVQKEYDLDDGDYEVEFVLDGVEYEYEVNAVTGKVTEVDVDHRDDADDIYDDDWDDDRDDADDAYDDAYDDDWDDDRDDADDAYDDDWDDDRDDADDAYDDDWDDDRDGADDVDDDDRDDDRDHADDIYDDDWDD